MKISNINARKYVENKEIFKGNNIFSTIEGSFYKVYSYGYHFPIYAYDLKNDRWYGNIDKYSITTSKHKNQCKPYGSAISDLNTEELKKLV